MMPKEYGGIMRRFVTVAAVCMALFHILYISHVLEYLGIYLYQAAFRGVSVAFILALIYLVYPMRKSTSRNRLPWYDVLILLVAITMPLYYAFGYSSELYRWEMGDITVLETIMGCVTLVAVFEATRRIVGLPMSLLAVLLVIYAIFGHSFPGFFRHKGFELGFFINDVCYSEAGLFGFITGIGSTIVIMFIIFGQFLLTSGAGDFFVKLAYSLMGKYRGGPAKVAIVASCFFATISGESVANVATTGTLTIPLMKKVGYKPEFAGAVEAVASNGGQLTPPVMGAVAFVMADWLQIPYWTICLAAAIPAFLYFFTLFIFLDIEAVKRNLSGMPASELPSLKETIKDGWIYVLPLGLLVYLIGGLRYPPETACLYSLLFLVIVTMFRKRTRMGPQKLLSGLKNGAINALIACVTCITANIILDSLYLTGLAIKLTSAIISLSGGYLFVALLLGAATSFVMGMGLCTMAIYLILGSLVAPVLVEMGVPILAAHLFVFWWGLTNFITPPVCCNVFVACAIAGSDVWKTAFRAMYLGIMSYILPFIFVYHPALILIGHPLDIVRSVFITIAAVTMLAYGMGRWLLVRLALWESALLIASGVLLLLHSWTTILVGLGIGVGVFLLKRRQYNKIATLPKVVKENDNL